MLWGLELLGIAEERVTMATTMTMTMTGSLGGASKEEAEATEERQGSHSESWQKQDMRRRQRRYKNMQGPQRIGPGPRRLGYELAERLTGACHGWVQDLGQRPLESGQVGRADLCEIGQNDNPSLQLLAID